jgi:alkylated DNA repair dioxygenase AlkB
MTLALFDEAEPPTTEPLEAGAAVLRGFARARADVLLEAIDAVVAAAPTACRWR